MKKTGLLIVALLGCFVLSVNALPVNNMATVQKGLPIDGPDSPINGLGGQPSRVPPGAVIIGPTGFGDAWRGTSGSPGKSIVCSQSGDSLFAVYSSFSGNATTPANLIFSSSTDGGLTWSPQTIISNRNARVYNGAAADGNFTPYVTWQDRTGGTAPWPMKHTYDEGGFNGGLWASPIVLTNSKAFYLPSLSVGGLNGANLLTGAFAHTAFFFNAEAHMARATIDPTLSNPPVWEAPWDLTDPVNGWYEWFRNTNNAVDMDQDTWDYLLQPGGPNVIAFNERYNDETIQGNQAGYYRYMPSYRLSTDNGNTWTEGAPLIFTGEDTLPAQYTLGGWWYWFDGSWIGDRPHINFIHNDDRWNTNALYEAHPTVAGNYTQWTWNRVSETPGTAVGVTEVYGYGADYSSISHDAAGNIFIVYKEYRHDRVSREIWAAASTDGGNNWKMPVRITDDTLFNYSFIEQSEFAGGGKVHFFFHEYDLNDNIYYMDFPTATLLAAPDRPNQWTVAPRPIPTYVGWSVDSTNTPTVTNDTLEFMWNPAIDVNARYQLQVSHDPAFPNNLTWDYTGGGNGSFPLKANRIQRTNPLTGTLWYGTLGMPEASTQTWYWRVRSYQGPWNAWTLTSPMSNTYKFIYQPATVSSEWTLTGVAGQPPQPLSYKFALQTNRPNPMGDRTEFSFTLPKAGAYSLRVYNIAGQMVKEFSGRGAAGANTINWNDRTINNGVYFYKLTAGNNTATRKLVVVK